MLVVITDFIIKSMGRVDLTSEHPCSTSDDLMTLIRQPRKTIYNLLIFFLARIVFPKIEMYFLFA